MNTIKDKDSELDQAVSRHLSDRNERELKFEQKEHSLKSNLNEALVKVANLEIEVKEVSEISEKVS